MDKHMHLWSGLSQPYRQTPNIRRTKCLNLNAFSSRHAVDFVQSIEGKF